MSAIIEIENLSKTYEAAFGGQDVHALKDLSLQVQAGEIFGYLGPNGSGKTTTIKMLLGLIFPSSGTMRIMGREDIASPAVRRNIGYLPEGAYYPDFLRGEEVLRFYGSLYGMTGRSLEKRIDETLELVGMTRARKRLIRGYSKGMRQRIGLAQALLSDPQLLILDEPTTGLDPIARKEIRDILVRLRNEGKTLLISSHELLEVELISNRVGILFEGVLQTIGTIDELLSARDTIITVEMPSSDMRPVLVAKGLRIEDYVEQQAHLRVPITMNIHDAFESCKACNVKILSVSPSRETLEELFVRTVGSAAREKEMSA